MSDYQWINLNKTVERVRVCSYDAGNPGLIYLH